MRSPYFRAPRRAGTHLGTLARCAAAVAASTGEALHRLSAIANRDAVNA